MLCTTLLPAQRVAVVFSGGGAKGLVHLGALKALEENEIPIDAIAGTSIGAIIGGMYAAGYTVDEMVTYLMSEDFKRWSTGDFSKEGYYYYKQYDPDAEMFSLRMNIDRKWNTKFVLPTNLIQPYQMDFAFMQLFAGANAAAKGNLDSLMVPFRAMSYDAYYKRPYAPSRGDLGTLVRASMSFPGIFKPAVVDSMLLFDGGMVNNFPVNVAQEEFSPDFIIGVKCSDNYDRPTEDDVFSHITSLMSRPTEYQIPQGKGVLIDMDSLGDVNLMDFNRVKELMEQGYRETMEQIPYIKRSVQRRVTEENVYLKRLAFRKEIPPYKFSKVQVSGVHEGLETYIKEELESEPGKTFSLKEVKKRYFGVVSDGAVSTFYPVAIYNEADSTYDMKIRASSAPNIRLALGGCFSNFSNLGFLGGEYQHFSTFKWRLGGNIYFGNVYNSQKLYSRIDTRIKKWRIPVFTEAAITHNSFDYYSSNPDMIFSDTRPDFIQDDEVFGALNVGTHFLLNSALRLGGTVGVRNAQYYATQDFKSGDIPEKMTFNFISGNLSIDRNTLNYKMYPTKGLVEQLSLSYVWGKEFHTNGTTSYDNDTTKIGKKEPKGLHKFFSLKYMRQDYALDFKHFTLGYHLEGVLSQNVLLSDYYSTLLMLPAFQPIPNLQGFFLENFRASRYVAAGLIPTFAVFDRFYMRTEAYAFLPFTTLSKENTTSPVRYESGSDLLSSIKIMAAATLVLNTPVGPLAASMSYYTKDNNQFYFSISFGYNIYNKRAFNN